MPTLITLIVLLVIGVYLKRQAPRSQRGWGEVFDNWLSSSNLILFGAPISTGLLVAFAAYVNGVLPEVGKAFSTVFIALITFNVFYRISGRDRYPLRVSAFYLFVLGGSAGTLLLLHIG